MYSCTRGKREALQWEHLIHIADCIALWRMSWGDVKHTTPPHLLFTQICFFLFLHTHWTHKALACSWIPVLSTMELSQLIDFCIMQLLCHFCAIVLKNNFQNIPKITYFGFVWSVYRKSYPILTQREVRNYIFRKGKKTWDSQLNLCECILHPQMLV